MAAAEETLRLEGFAESLRSRRIYCCASHTSQKFVQKFLRGRVAALDAELVHRGRKVLFVAAGGGAGAAAAPAAPKWVLHMNWDAIFHIKEVQDLKLALTYVQHSIKPTRVVWLGGEPPLAAHQIFSRIEGLSLLCIGERVPVQEWDAVFWSPEAETEFVESFVLHRMGAGRTGTLRSVMRELRASDVGLVWSSIGESDKRGELYWYDPGEGVDTAGHHIDPVEAAETLRAIADMLGARG